MIYLLDRARPDPGTGNPRHVAGVRVRATMRSCDVPSSPAGMIGRNDTTHEPCDPPIQRYRRSLRSVRGWFAPLMLAAARGRRRPARWLLPVLGIALAAAFAAGVAAQSQVAGDQSARSVLDGTSRLGSEVRVTWQGPVGPGVADQARALLRGLGLGSQTEVVLMNPVRLGGVVVRPAAIAPLDRWLPGIPPGRLGPCRPERCPMLLAGRPARSPRPWRRSASASRSSARHRCARRSPSGSCRRARGSPGLCRCS